MTTPEPKRLVWMAIRSDIYYPETAKADPHTAALEYLNNFGDEEPFTIAEFEMSDVVNMLPNDLFGQFLENLAENLHDGYTEDSAEGEMLDALYHRARNEKTPAHEEVNALLRPAFEGWWRKHATDFGVHACYTATGKTQTFTPKEIKTLETP